MRANEQYWLTWYMVDDATENDAAVNDGETWADWDFSWSVPTLYVYKKRPGTRDRQYRCMEIHVDVPENAVVQAPGSDRT